MNLLFSLLPIIVLIWLMTKKKPVASHIALPLIGLSCYLIQLFWFKADFILVNAHLISAILLTLTPISIIAGAILLNGLMQRSGAEKTMCQWLANISDNPIAQLMTIGWAFAFMIEGASGFGTPAAIAAPILVGLGFRALPVAILALIMNTVPVSFGAVGTPTWFGFSTLTLNGLPFSETQLLQVGYYSVIIHCVAALIIPILALRIVVSWQMIKANFLYIYASIFACTIPYFFLAQVNYEFPALVAGAIGLLISIGLAKINFGLAPCVASEHTTNISPKAALKALSPYILLIFILIITRLKQLPFKSLLNDMTAFLEFNLGFLGDFSVSRALIFRLQNIFQTDAFAEYRTLYVPAIIPFLLVVLISIYIFKLKSHQIKPLFSSTLASLTKPLFAVIGALVMVNMMRMGNDHSPIIVIGQSLASLAGEYWQYFASFLGAIGTFFSGSNTISNMTFGGIQQAIATDVGSDISLILALQSVGGAMGNMVCIHSIIAVCTILGIHNQEGYILKRTVIPVIIYGVIAGFMAFIIQYFLIQ